MLQIEMRPGAKKNKSDDDSDKNEQARFGPQLRIS